MSNTIEARLLRFEENLKYCMKWYWRNITLSVSVVALLTIVIFSVVTAYTSLTDRMRSIETQMSSLDTRMDNLDDRMDNLDDRMDGLDDRMDGLDDRMDGFETQMAQGFSNLEKLILEIRGVGNNTIGAMIPN